MYSIVSNRTTELIAKRRAIEEAMRYWEENPLEYFAKLEVSYLPAVANPKRKREIVEARREVISEYLKIESLQYFKLLNGSLRLTKDEYLELWVFLRENQISKKSKIKN